MAVDQCRVASTTTKQSTRQLGLARLLQCLVGVCLARSLENPLRPLAAACARHVPGKPEPPDAAAIPACGLRASLAGTAKKPARPSDAVTAARSPSAANSAFASSVELALQRTADGSAPNAATNVGKPSAAGITKSRFPESSMVASRFSASAEARASSAKNAEGFAGNLACADPPRHCLP